jgi:5-methylcytosine-specific restriction endonuclease McrA
MAVATEPQNLEEVAVYKDRYARYRAKHRERLHAERLAKSAVLLALNPNHYREIRIANRERRLIAEAKWREQNRELARERVKQFLAANPGKELEYARRYRARDPELTRKRNKAARERRGDKEKVYRKAYCAANLDKLAAKAALRRALKFKATPSWADESAILMVYGRAKRLTKETGIPHHVDHIVPLKSKIVCGLHWEANLQVLPGDENLSKSNRHWPDMP